MAGMEGGRTGGCGGGGWGYSLWEGEGVVGGGAVWGKGREEGVVIGQTKRILHVFCTHDYVLNAIA